MLHTKCEEDLNYAKYRNPKKAKAMTKMTDTHDTNNPAPVSPQTDLTAHAVSDRSLLPPWPQDFEEAVFAMGCFWGVERLFWQAPGVWVTMAGYAGGDDLAPTYKSVCTGETGHAEVVRVIYDPTVITYKQLLQMFWNNHNPTQGMRQGNDIGAQYRSIIFANSDEQMTLAQSTKESFQEQLDAKGMGEITTRIVAPAPFYYAEDDHQQYLAKNKDGYCGLKGIGVPCII